MIRTGVFDYLRREANNKSNSSDTRRLLQLVIRMTDEDVNLRPSAKEVVETLRGKIDNIENFVKRPTTDVTEIWGRVAVKDVQALADLGGGLPKALERLEVEVLPEGSTQEEKKKALQRLLSELPASLEVLKLSGFEIYDHTGRLLEYHLKKLTNLRELDLSGNDMGDEGAKLVAQVLQGLPHLTHLNLSNNFVGNEGAEKLLNELVDLPNLQVDLSWNKIWTWKPLGFWNVSFLPQKCDVMLFDLYDLMNEKISAN